MNDTQIFEIMNQLGLSKYEQLVLKALYDSGQSSADEISKVSKVPLTRVYESLETLSSKYFVSASLGRPKLYSAIEPREAISKFIELEKSKHEKILEEISDAGTHFLDLLESTYLESYTQITPEDLLSQFTSLEDAERYTLNLIKSAKVEIKIFSYIFNWYRAVKEHLIKASQRGCSVKIILKDNIESKNLVKEFEDLNFEYKLIETRVLPARGTIIDQTWVIFVIWANEMIDDIKKRRIYNPHYSTNIGIIDVFEGYFNYLWLNH